MGGGFNLSKLPCGIMFKTGLGECCLDNCPYSNIKDLKKEDKIPAIEVCYQKCKEKKYPEYVMESGLVKKELRSLIS